MSSTLTPDELAWAQQIALSPREVKTEFIAELMGKMHWFGPESVRELATVWKTGGPTIHAWSKDARKQFRMSLPNWEDLVRRQLENLEFLAADALRKRKPMKDGDGIIHMVPDPDHATARACLETSLKTLAAITPPPSRAGTDAYDGKNLDELLAAAAAKGLLPTPAINVGIPNDESENVDDGDAGNHARAAGADHVRGGLTRRARDPIHGQRDYRGAAVGPGDNRAPRPGLRPEGHRGGGHKDHRVEGRELDTDGTDAD